MRITFIGSARRKVALTAAIAALGALGLGDGAAAVSHADCQIHGARPYPHRHVDPGDRAISCERPVITGRFATSARCVAQGLRGGAPVLGTRVSSELPLAPNALAATRASALNQACAEALAGCEQAASTLGGAVRCEVMDRNFAR